MNDLKFELSVLFTKKELNPFTNTVIEIKEQYQQFFGKEVEDEEIAKEIGNIINDQFTMYEDFIQEVPEDFEYDTNRKSK